jgi:enterochelin esterase-like enzyme
MRKVALFFSLWLFAGTTIVFAQQQSHKVTFKVTVAAEIKSSFVPTGRLFIFLDAYPGREPRTCSPTSYSVIGFAKNLNNFNPEATYIIDSDDGWMKWQSTSFLTYEDEEMGLKIIKDFTFENIPEGQYRVQLLWDQDNIESSINAPGNIFSKVHEVMIDQSQEVQISLSEIIDQRELVQHNLAREINYRSDTLSKWWGKDVIVKASVLLPGKYLEDKNVTYPICYYVSGYGGRYTRINNLINDENFMDWWVSEEAPQIIIVFLDGEGPFGDSYQMDSENNGPFGYNLIHELIPYIESKYRGGNNPETRFVYGCSTGGWVSLALQLIYPDIFNGCFSYSPDPVDFQHLLLTNIYKDKNAFINEYGFQQPVRRLLNGKPQISMKDWIQFENVMSSSNSYVNSGHQFGAYSAVFGPRGKNGLPLPLFDPVTGKIDQKVAESWAKYDLKLFCEKNWKVLGPKLQGKIYIWMGDMDSYHLNFATRSFDQFLKSTENPRSDAIVEFSPMDLHCAKFSHQRILEQVVNRLAEQ